MPVIINQKYVEETRKKLKTPSNLEILLQDVSKLVKHNETIGNTYFDRWFFFLEYKNNIQWN